MVDNTLIEELKKYMKRGKNEQFYEYIVQNNLTDRFIQQSVTETFRKNYEIGTEEYKNAINLSEFVFKISNDVCNKKFGAELSDKFSQIIYKEEQPFLRIIMISQLMKLNIKVKTKNEAMEIAKLLDMASSQDTLIGTHIIGADTGELLVKNGIQLTGHKYVANDYESKDGNIRRMLFKNITFFDNNPIGLLSEIINKREYNNPTTDFNDIMIVSIPKEELDKNQEGIVIQKDFGEGPENCLNPEYINGFVRIGVRDGEIEGFYDNPYFKDKSRKSNENITESLSISDWEAKFDGWYRQANVTHLQNLKNKVMSFLKTIIRKDRDKDISNEEIR